MLLFIIHNNKLFQVTKVMKSTVALIKSSSRKKSIYLQTLKVGANDRSAQELQNGL